MKRDINFVAEGQLAAALGLTPEGMARHEENARSIIESGGTIKDVLTYFNEKENLSDAEWTAMVFALGYFDGYNSV